MATAKKSTKTKKMIQDFDIISMYMDNVLKSNHEPKNIYTFCQENSIEETLFYTYYGSFDSLKEDIWVKFFENVNKTLSNDKSYISYTDKDKLLALYFTFFEILSLNRSYVVFALKENRLGLKNLKQLKLLRNQFKEFIVSIIESSSEDKNENIQKITKPVFSEGAWIQFLFLLKFWLDDVSKSFEKTDIMIEKSVKAVTDVLNTTPLESILDLGKFIWKEKFN